MASDKAKASCTAAFVCEKLGVVQELDSSETPAPVPKAPVTADMICLPPLPEQSPGHFHAVPDIAIINHLPLQPQQSSAGEQSVTDIRSKWNLMQVFTELGTEENCIAFCEEQRLLPVTKKCRYHKLPMIFSDAGSPGQFGQFRCYKSNCKTKPVPRSRGTWFENMHLALPVAFQMMYLYSHRASYEDVRRETSLKTGPVVSTKTIADWYSYCRETVLIYELEHQNYETQIGGKDKIVIIDQSKFGKRKYKKGKNMEGRLVLGMLENGGNDLRLEVCPNRKKSGDVLMPLIQKHVAKGSIIRTCFWKGYDWLPKYGYIHERVDYGDQDNNSAATDGTQNREIVKNWRALKAQFPKLKCKRNFLNWLAEFSWRRKNKMNKKDPFEELLKVVKYVYR